MLTGGDLIFDALDVGMLGYTSGGKSRVDGLIDTPNQRIPIHVDSPVATVEHLAQDAVLIKARHRRQRALDQLPASGDLGRLRPRSPGDPARPCP